MNRNVYNVYKVAVMHTDRRPTTYLIAANTSEQARTAAIQLDNKAYKTAFGREQSPTHADVEQLGFLDAIVKYKRAA